MVKLFYSGGRMGNKMFEYAIARIIAESKGYRLYTIPIEGFENTKTVVNGATITRNLYYNNHLFRLNIPHIKQHKGGIVLQGYFQRYDLIKEHKEKIKQWFHVENDNWEKPGDNDLVVHIRLGDYKDIGNNYLGFDYYYSTIKSETYDKCYIVTDEPTHEDIKKLESLGCEIVSRSTMEDYYFLRNAKKLVISHSTFSWWAAYLGEAHTIHFPIHNGLNSRGFWGKGHDLDLIIDDDPRIKYKKLDMMLDGVKNIVFFNHFHNGDIHVSRGFLKFITEKFPQFNYFYTHKNSSNLTKDLNITFLPDDINNNPYIQEQLMSYKKQGDTIYINTWYCSGHRRFFKECTFISLYNLFEFYFQEIFGLNIKDYDEQLFLPSIDFNRCLTEHVDEFFITNNKPTILISNGNTLSGQSSNFDFNPLIIQLSKTFPEHNFLLSNKMGIIIKENNVFYTEDIIKSKENDLNENAYISLKCNIIIGRDSGTYTFCYIKENILNPDKAFLSFSYNNIITNWYENRRAKISHSLKMNSYQEIFNVIESVIKSN